MIAKTQYQLSAADLAVVLAMVRGGTLAAAGERLDANASTVFRALRRIERGVGAALFERSRHGYVALELAQAMAAKAEQIEATLEAARSAAQLVPEQVAGVVRITTTDTILHGLVAPALLALRDVHPLLGYELHAGNELASLTRRDADIAVRATKRPPPHLVGRQVGTLRVAVFAAKKGSVRARAQVAAGHADWIAPDDALPEHPSVVWRKRQHPKVEPRYRVNSILSVLELVALGLGVGVLPLFLAAERPDVVALTEPLESAATDLWLLAHPESRHLRRVAAVYAHFAGTLRLP